METGSKGIRQLTAATNSATSNGTGRFPGRSVKVGTIGGRTLDDFYGYDVQDFDPFEHMDPGLHGSLVDFLREGRRGYRLANRLYTAEGVDSLYRRRDPGYMRMLEAFVERFRNVDILILSSFNPVHPEVLQREFPGVVKVLGFIDDPVSSYTRGIPYLWAFDGAVYISPGYSEDALMEDKLAQWGCRESYWWPLVPYGTDPEGEDDAFFHDRDLDLCYVGGAYGEKIDRLVQFRKHFGRRMQIYGRWPLRGWFGTFRFMYGKPALFMRVPAITDAQRTSVYRRTRIGLNMHLSTVPRETGNMRMYEIPAHGMMQVCDVGGLDSNEKIFAGCTEAVYYRSVDEAIHLIEYYLDHDEERIQIAMNGFERVRREYRWESCYRKLLDWASSLMPAVVRQDS